MRLPKPTHSNYSSLINDVENGTIKIPQFQRDFVWSIQKSATLIDSVVKGYPIGTLIFWATKDRLRSVRDIGGIDLPLPRDGDQVLYVLDGQQRLTSLFAALKGLEVRRDSGLSENFAEIYLDLTATEEDQIVFTDLSERNLNMCIRLHDLLGGSLTKLAAYPEKLHGKIDEYRRRIEGYDFPVVEVSDVPIEVATEIFTRINVGGKPLSLFEIMVAKTYDESREFDLSEKFDELVDRLAIIEYDTISDATVLQLIALILGSECKRQTILALERNQFIDVWAAVSDAIERAAEYFRQTYRIPVSRLLPYSALLVPFGYFFYKHSDKPSAEMAQLLGDFFWRCSLGGRYSSSVESKLAQDIAKIDLILGNKVPDYDWAIDLSPSFIRENGWFNTSRSFVKAILCLYAYNQPKSFNDDSLVRISNDWLKQANSKNYHHFFPRSYLAKHGVDEVVANNVVNITIVDDYLNKRVIRDQAPGKYMKKFRKENKNLANTMKSHLIDDLESFGIFENSYEQFLQKRAEEIGRQLRERVVERSTDRGGQVVRQDDVEEEAVMSQ